MEKRKVKELKDIINHFNDEDYFYLEEGILIFECNDNSCCQGETVDVRDVLNTY